MTDGHMIEAFDRGNYHEIIVHEGSEQAAEVLFDYILRIHQAHLARNTEQRLRFMVSILALRQLPIARIVARVRRDRERWDASSRTVVLHPDIALVNFTVGLLKAMRFPMGDVRTFRLTERDQALEWLLKDN
jgi:hypothetical protein